MAPSRSEPYDVLVVGAGPAGLAAAAASVAAGARVAVVDAGDRPGGQYWRQPATVAAPDEAMQHDLATYRRLMATAGTAEWFAGHAVWTLTRTASGFAVHAVTRTAGTETRATLFARRLVLAPGAYDRQLPFPGWDLPGVMTAGGVQALLKGHGVLAGRRVLLAGTGPFLLPVAAGLVRAGAQVAGVHEASRGTRWLRSPGAVARNAAKLTEGLGYAATLARHRVPVHRSSAVLAAHGDHAVTSATVGRLDRDGRVRRTSGHTVDVDLIAVGWGFTPQLELPLALGCATRVDLDGSLVCTVDDDQRSSIDGVWVAGEACGVGGAALAVAEGEIAGAAAAGAAAPTSARRRRAAGRAFAVAMHQAHPVPAGWTDRVTDDTVVCRCEEVTAGALRAAVDELGADTARSAKLVVRTGMGWCQGRVCGYATSCLVAEQTGRRPSPPLPERPIAVPLTLGALAESAD